MPALQRCLNMLSSCTPLASYSERGRRSGEGSTPGTRPGCRYPPRGGGSLGTGEVRQWGGPPHGGDFRERERHFPEHVIADAWLDTFSARYAAVRVE